MARHFSKTGTVDYQTIIKKTSVQDRVNMLNSSYGQSLLSSLTAEQYASLFPRYYLERLPQIEGFMKALTPEGRGAVARGAQIEGGTYSKPGGTMPAPTATPAGAKPNTKPSWVAKLEQETGVAVSDPGAKVQLSQERQDIVKMLKAGEIPADDPRVGFLKDLSAADLQKAGLQKNDKGDGKYTYSKPEVQVSDEEVDKRIAESSSKAGLNKDTKLVEHEPSHTTTALGIDKRQYNAFRESLAGIESAGGKYGIMGGSSGRFSGAYQFGAAEIRETARQLGEPEPSREQFLKDPALQERFLDRYTKAHHDQLMNNPKYAAMGPEERLGVLAYAHNQGAGGASKWLTTGQAGSDAFGTSGTKYTSAVAAQLAKTKDQTAEPTENTPEARQAMRDKIIKEREAQHETALAMSTIPKLPEGVDPKVAAYYERLNPGQKQKFHEALGKMGSDTPTAVAKLNETYQKNPESIGMTAMRPSGNIEIPKNQSDANKVIAEQASGTTKYQASTIDKAITLLGAHERTDREQLKEYLAKAGASGKGFDPAASPWCAAFVNATLAQQGIAIPSKDPNLARSFHSWGELKKAEETSAGDVLAYNDGSHVGISTGRTRVNRDGSMSIEMIAGNHGDKVSKDWVKAGQVSVRRATEDQYHPEVLAAIKRGEVDQTTVAAIQDQTGVKVGDKSQQPPPEGLASTNVPGAPGSQKPTEAKPAQQQTAEAKPTEAKPTEAKPQGIGTTNVPGAPGSLQAQATSTIPVTQQATVKPKAVLAAGTNDWDNEDKAYQGVKQSIQALIAKGEDPSLVLPAKLVNGKPHAYNGAKRAAEELGVEAHYPSGFGQGADHYHINAAAAEEIKTKYVGAKFYGDSNSVRLGAKEGETGFTGKGGEHIASQITASSQPKNQSQQTAEVKASESTSSGEIKRFSLASNKFEEPPKPDNSDPSQRKVQSPFATSPGTADAIKRATESAAQAAEISGPKKFNSETGKWEAYQLAEQPKYQKPEIIEPQAPKQPEQKVASENTSPPEGEPTRVAVLADGGEADTGGSSEISAYPIGALKGDNAIIANADQEPLFTMNTNKENASYDSGSGKVSVEPVTKNNPDSLVGSKEEGGGTKDSESQSQASEQQSEGAMISGLKQQPNMSFEAATQLSANPITCPSFQRAISAAGFQKSGSHNDDGATNLR